MTRPDLRAFSRIWCILANLRRLSSSLSTMARPTAAFEMTLRRGARPWVNPSQEALQGRVREFDPAACSPEMELVLDDWRMAVAATNPND
jgi:hypothetical protein